MSAPLKVELKKKPVDIRRREVTVSLIGETLCSMPADGTLPVDRMIRYWTEAMDLESSRKPDMFVLPEICDVWLGISPERKLEWLDARGDRVLTAFQEYAKKHHAYIVYPTYRDLEGGHHSNCSLLIDREGDLIACYDKAYPTVRDISVGVIPGHDAVAAETDFGRLSFAICFDIYFWEIMERVAALRSAVPGIGLSTDIIVGFPGETEEQFEDTMNLIREIRYDSAFTFVYSPRVGTAAARMPDQVPEDVSGERIKRLIELQETLQQETLRRFVGMREEVLVEGLSRRSGDAVSGKGRHAVSVTMPGGADEIGKIVPCRITGIKNNTLMAEKET